MLEDESGRLRLVGHPLQTSMLVTGCVIAVMGTENSNGDFEIIDLRVPDLPPQPQRWERNNRPVALANSEQTSKPGEHHGNNTGGKVAIVSGLGFSGEQADTLALDLFMEFLLGEACGPSTQISAGRISRLLIAGNSIVEGTPWLSETSHSIKKQARNTGMTHLLITRPQQII